MNDVDNNPKTRVGGANKLPLHLVPPRALAHIALAFADGGLKYQPYNWRDEKISSSVYYGAALRHLMSWWEGENVAPDGVAHHLAHAAACMIMILDTLNTEKLNDNRPPSLDPSFSSLMDDLSRSVTALKERSSTKFDLHDLPKATYGHSGRCEEK